MPTQAPKDAADESRSPDHSASEMTYIVSGGALNSTHSLSPDHCHSDVEELNH